MDFLSEEEIKDQLILIPGWQYQNHKISKEFVFASFKTGLALINTLALYLDKVNHHPSICVYYKKIRFELTTHDAGDKVTLKDFQVAQKIEELYKDQLF